MTWIFISEAESYYVSQEKALLSVTIQVKMEIQENAAFATCSKK